VKKIFLSGLILLIFASLASGGSRARGGGTDCESGHWVQEVHDNGRIVQLEDGSVWEVDPVDAIDSALWLPTTSIIACPDRLINTDDSEVVSAIQLR
jgi:hypothetical protein